MKPKTPVILPDGSSCFVMDVPLVNPNKEKYPTFEDWKKAHGMM